jgi:Flp pilus assembly secretin CpaC
MSYTPVILQGNKTITALNVPVLLSYTPVILQGNKTSSI